VGVTFDTGALIALEKRKPRMGKVLRTLREDGVLITVPAVVVTEWWRGQRRPISRILAAVLIEPTTARLAKIAGEALAAVKGATPIDAIVMASAAQRGDVVYTSDVSDLSALADHFPMVLVLGV
jgi:predicted nucleic acid-binding protein